jgi:hypothetical protein
MQDCRDSGQRCFGDVESVQFTFEFMFLCREKKEDSGMDYLYRKDISKARKKQNNEENGKLGT